LGVLDPGDRDKDNKAGLKEGGGIKIETTVLHCAMPQQILKQNECM